MIQNMQKEKVMDAHHEINLRKIIGVKRRHTSNELTIKLLSFAPILIKVSALGPKEGLFDMDSNAHPFMPIDTIKDILHIKTIPYAKYGLLAPPPLLLSTKSHQRI